MLKRQFEKCSNDNFYKTLYFNRKSFCNILGAEWHLLPLEKTKIINSDLAVLYIIYGLKYQNYEREHHSGDSCENAA